MTGAVVVKDRYSGFAVTSRIAASVDFPNRKSHQQFVVQFAAIAWSYHLTSLRRRAAGFRLVRSSRSPQHGGQYLMEILQSA
jgi:hypothetical protein